MDEYTLDNGHTVRVGDEYTMNYENKQLDIPNGTEMTVTRITPHPDGTHIVFDCHFDDVPQARVDDGRGREATIYAFAMQNLLNDDGIIAQ